MLRAFNEYNYASGSVCVFNAAIIESDENAIILINSRNSKGRKDVHVPDRFSNQYFYVSFQY